jgi:protein O-GlcNAc transferase
VAVTKGDPSNADAHANAGLAYQRLASAAEAEQSFLEALAQDPNHAVALYGYGQIQLQRGVHAKAYEAAQVLTQAHPTMVAGWELLGAVQLVQGDPERAELAFKKAFELGNGSVGARLGLARVLLLKKQPAQALKMVEGITADDSVYLTVVGAAHGELGDLAQAKALLTQAVAKDPGSPTAQFNLGVVLERLQELAAAKESYAAALKLDPTLEQAEQALRRL